MRRGIAKVVSAMVAAALMCSLVPAASFASEQQSATAPAANSASARASQVSITVPATLDMGNGEVLAIEDVDSWGPFSTSVTFENTSQVDLYLSEIKVQQGAVLGGMWDWLFDTGVLAMSFKAAGADSGASNDAVALLGHVEASVQSLDMPADAQTALACPAGEEVAFTFEVDHSKAQPWPYDSLRSLIDNYWYGSGEFGLGSLCYTFQVALPAGTGDGNGSAADNGGLFLKVLNPPQTEALKPWAGQTYNLDDVKAHSRGLPVAGTSSDLYTLYNLLATSMTPEGDYECYVSYDNEDWPVRIIGVNQDIAASTGQGFTQGKPVGLTFQFRDLVKVNATEGDLSNEGGWGGSQAANLRDPLQPGGEGYEKMHDGIKKNIVAVKKAYCADSLRVTSDVEQSIDAMFLPSWYEIAGLDLKNSSLCPPGEEFPWFTNEGTGAAHNEQYLFYQNKGIQHKSSEGGPNYTWLEKRNVRNWETARVVTADGGNKSVFGSNWMLRTLSLLNDDAYLEYGNGGAKSTGFVTGSNYKYICPCFCL